MIRKRKNPFLRAAKHNQLSAKLTEYLDLCRNADAGQKNRNAFPNLAGFCRYLGCGTAAFDEFQSADPDLADWLRAVFEDETLNLSLSPTLLSAYLKRRLGYAEKTKAEEVAAECGEMKLVFEHDILEDGA